MTSGTPFDTPPRPTVIDRILALEIWCEVLNRRTRRQDEDIADLKRAMERIRKPLVLARWAGKGIWRGYCREPYKWTATLVLIAALITKRLPFETLVEILKAALLSSHG